MQILSMLSVAVLSAAVTFGYSKSGTDHEPFIIEGSAIATDGDSLRIDEKRIRLEGIDAPELRQHCYLNRQPQPCGITSHHTLQRIIHGETVTCNVTGKDRYNRYLAHCYARGENINAAMVSLGQALAYDHYSKRYVLQERAARDTNVGIHQYKYTYPWEWRRNNPR